jgi:hypothetical protein
MVGGQQSAVQISICRSRAPQWRQRGTGVAAILNRTIGAQRSPELQEPAIPQRWETWREESIVNPLLSQAIAAIASDNRSGAAQIAFRAADILLHHVGTDEAAAPAAFRQELLAIG